MPESRLPPLSRAARFCDRFELDAPVLLAPMAGACPPSLSIAVASAGGLGACGALLMSPQEIHDWANEFRSGADGDFQMNNWIPDPPPLRDRRQEAKIMKFIGEWGTEAPQDAAHDRLPDFEAQCEAMLEVRPHVISSIMGLYPDDFARRCKEAGIRWLATVTTVAEAMAAEAAGADAVVAQGMEAGGHRGTFDPDYAHRAMAGLFALVPAVVDAIEIPVVAAGGIADGRGIAAAFALGASAVQVGTGFLRCPEAGTPAAWADAIAETRPDSTIATRAFTGRLGRSTANRYALAAEATDAPEPAPYPVQRNLTKSMTGKARLENDIDRMQAWTGQSGRLAQAKPAGELLRQMLSDARALLE